MSVRDFEKTIWRECQKVACNKKLRLKDLLEWSTGKLKPEDKTEVVLFLPETGCQVCIPRVHDLR